MHTSSRFPFRWIAITAAFINLSIHLSLSQSHLEEKLYIGVLFVIGSALLGMVVVGLSTDRDRVRTLAWVSGSLVCAGMFISFVLSRTVGLPQGYQEAWIGKPEDLLGLASLALELVFIGCAVVSVTTSRGVVTQSHATRTSLHDRTAPLA